MPIALHLRADTRTACVGVFEVPYPLILLHPRADTRPARGVVGVVDVTGIWGSVIALVAWLVVGVIHEAGRVAA